MLSDKKMPSCNDDNDDDHHHDKKNNNKSNDFYLSVEVFGAVALIGDTINQ